MAGGRGRPFYVQSSPSSVGTTDHQPLSHSSEQTGAPFKGSVGIPPQVKMLRDYVTMTLTAELSTLQRLHCLVTIAGIARRGDVWRRLLVSGPENYWGLSFAGR